jgi:hypothetical protein
MNGVAGCGLYRWCYDSTPRLALRQGDMTAADRDAVVAEFRSGITKVLIATDVLARGFDVSQASLVGPSTAQRGKPRWHVPAVMSDRCLVFAPAVAGCVRAWGPCHAPSQALISRARVRVHSRALPVVSPAYVERGVRPMPRKLHTLPSALGTSGGTNPARRRRCR